MLNNFPLWPQQASTLAGHVDALYIFLLIVTGMMALLVFVCIIFLPPVTVIVPASAPNR